MTWVSANAFHLAVLFNKELARSFQNLVEFGFGDFSNLVKDDVVFDTEKSLRTNEAGLIDLTAFTIGFIKRDGKTIGMRAAGDLAEDQVRAW